MPFALLFSLIFSSALYAVDPPIRPKGRCLADLQSLIAHDLKEREKFEITRQGVALLEIHVENKLAAARTPVDKIRLKSELFVARAVKSLLDRVLAKSAQTALPLHVSLSGERWEIAEVGDLMVYRSEVQPPKSVRDGSLATFLGILKQGQFKNIGDARGLAYENQSVTGDIASWFIVKAADSKPETRSILPAQVFDQYLSFLFRQYEIRMRMSAAVVEKLQAVSRSVEDRSVIFIQSAGRIPQLTNTPIKNLSISGGAVVTFSSAARDTLPLEIFTGVPVIRQHEGERVAEIGRFSVAKEHSENSERLVLMVAHALFDNEEVDRVLIEADVARSRIFKRYGFRAIREQVNFQGKKEFIMEVTPNELLNQAIKRSANEFEDGSS